MKQQSLDQRDLALLFQYGLSGLDLNHGIKLSFSPGEFLLHAGEPMEYIYFVVSGKAKVLLSLSDGKQLLLSYFLSKGIIGDVELVTDTQAASNTMQAVTEFTCIALPLRIYAERLKHNSVFLNILARELAEKLMERSINGTITTLQPLNARLCAYITQSANGGIFRETLTEVAALLGTSYRHLLRSLDQLCNDRILQKEATGYRITNPQALQQKAGDFYLLK